MLDTKADIQTERELREILEGESVPPLYTTIKTNGRYLLIGEK